MPAGGREAKKGERREGRKERDGIKDFIVV
jgi:hypothetical protein